jgi:hypothetical protein|tara:strand:+ start:1309 stop:2154 length:846 start_codon:yes stop_codon:yes gene_type:complete
MTDKMEHIAVVLRGHVRTWHYIYPLVFEFYESIAKEVDYYFITWDTSNSDNIIETFKGKNLIHFQIVPKTICNTLFYNSYEGPAFMGALLLPHINTREQTLKTPRKIYDAIIDSRPDVLPIRRVMLDVDRVGEQISFIKPEMDTAYVTGIEIQKNLGNAPKGNLDDVAIKDWFILHTSDSYKRLLDRYGKYKRTDAGCQIEYRECIEENKLNICIMDWLEAIMVRPTCFDISWELRNDHESIIDYSNEWPDTDSEKKKELCLKYGISMSDYMDTISITCKI